MARKDLRWLASALGARVRQWTPPRHKPKDTKKLRAAQKGGTLLVPPAIPVLRAGASERSFKTFFTSEQLPAYQRGTMKFCYRGRICIKSPIDLAIYLQLLQDVRPRTLIEIGSKAGGSALLFRDYGRMLDLQLEIVSIDIKRPKDECEGITFLEGDVNDLQPVFEKYRLDERPRPWLVVEDSAHTASACVAALRFFAKRLMPGEWMIMEDGVLDELGLSERYKGGPNLAIMQFFAANPGVFEVGAEYCDMFGQNATYNPNGYLQRTVAPFGAKTDE